MVLAWISDPQLIQDDSEGIRRTLQDFRSVLADISTVCDISTQEERLDQSYQEVHKMQSSIIEPLDHLLQAAAVRMSNTWLLRFFNVCVLLVRRDLNKNGIPHPQQVICYVPKYKLLSMRCNFLRRLLVLILPAGGGCWGGLEDDGEERHKNWVHFILNGHD